MHIEGLVLSQFFVLCTLALKTSLGHQHSRQLLSSLSQRSQVQEWIPPVIREIFLLLFTSPILKHIVQQTNQYAQECLGKWFSTWQLVTVEDLCTYIGFMILMGLVPLPSIQDYWKKDPTFHYSPVADRISRDRFLDIHRYLHFVDNSTISPPGSVEYDKLGKIWPIINAKSSTINSLYSPERDVSVDEAMVPLRGRSALKQYMPLKPVKRDFKIWMRADASNG